MSRWDLNSFLDRLHRENHLARGNVSAEKLEHVPVLDGKDLVDDRGLEDVIGENSQRVLVHIDFLTEVQMELIGTKRDLSATSAATSASAATTSASATTSATTVPVAAATRIIAAPLRIRALLGLGLELLGWAILRLTLVALRLHHHGSPATVTFCFFLFRG